MKISNVLLWCMAMFMMGALVSPIPAFSAPKAKLIPLSILFGNPVKATPRISPDGTRLAYLAPVNDVLNVWVKTIGKDDDKPVTNDTNRGIRSYFWAQDNKYILHIQDMGGNENWRLYKTDLASGETTDLTPYDSVQTQIVDHNRFHPNEMLIAMNKDNPQAHDVYHLDLITGELKLLAKNPGNFMGWMNDADLRILGGFAANAEGGFDLMIRPDENSDWQKLITWDANDAMTSGPISFSKDGKYLYLKDSRNVNAGRLTKMEIATGKTDVIAEDPQYDISNIMQNPETFEIEAVEFNKDRHEWKVLDQTIKADFEAISKLDRGEFYVTDRNTADDAWIVGYTVDNGPVSYYAYDRKTKKGTFLFYHMPALKDYALVTMEPISFKSRDGLTIHGYMTYPEGQRKKKLPMVLNVHGGPWYRDSWGFNPEAQWLANRGYVCLQVNFRGSSGYGKDFINAGDREWGGKMHNDLVDAVQWAIEQKIADPKKIAIYGGSYGGYAALVGATFTPDLFNCAVDIVGPSNLITWITSIPPYWSSMRTMLYNRVGNPDTEPDFLKSRSPLFKVDQIKIPMLIAQGANDPRVNQKESEQIVEAMKAKGIDCQYILFPDEGHGFAKPENRLKFYSIADKFLADHLGGQYEPEGRSEAK